MSEGQPIYAFVSFPDANYTESLIKKALAKLNSQIEIHDCLPASDSDGKQNRRILQWATYDLISHELTMAQPSGILSSSYVIRKSLIRKHFLHRSVQSYLAKNPDSDLKTMVPATWDVDISYADELDELWSDELYELGQVLPEDAEEEEGGGHTWYILKPGMADRGMGIRLFRSKAGLQAIFETFENESESEKEEDIEGIGSTDVVTSQLRHFVIQEYLPNPLLLDPRETLSTRLPFSGLQGRKFHLRAYCIAQGALKLHLCPRILALFSSTVYMPPSRDEEGSSALSAHLTNTSLQESHGEENVRLLQELVGCQILGAIDAGKGGSLDAETTRRLTHDDVDRIVDDVARCLAEAFRAGLTSAVHFQTLPNAFELFGSDLLVTFDTQTTPPFHVHLLELNAEPAIHLTGRRLGWILEELFDEIVKTCVAPFFTLKQDGSHAPLPTIANEQADVHAEDVRSQKGGHLRTCLEVQVRGASGW